MQKRPPKRRPFTVGPSEWLGTESNRRHADFQSAALPTELPSPKPFNLFELFPVSQRAPRRADRMLASAVRLDADNHRATNTQRSRDATEPNARVLSGYTRARAVKPPFVR